ncbi:MAG: hypothetical protein QM687_13985 [Ferruginibacter sp.]
MNTAIFLGTLLGFIMYAGEMFIATWYSQNIYEMFVFTDQQENSYFWYLFYLLYPVVLSLLFYWRKLRVSRVFIVLYYLLINAPLIYRWILSFTRDYLPSSWEYHSGKSYVDHLVIYFVLFTFIAVIYYIAYKRKKLPYPSLFLGQCIQLLS